MLYWRCWILQGRCLAEEAGVEPTFLTPYSLAYNGDRTAENTQSVAQNVAKTWGYAGTYPTLSLHILVTLQF